ncbi:MAG: PspC domain-containing protein [Prevotella sp.]
MKKRLAKSADKMLAGVCGGIADYYDIDSTLIRIGLVLVACMTAVVPTVVLYVIMSWIMPKSDFE